MVISEKTLLSELLSLEEDITPVLERHGLNCLGCPGSRVETLEEAAEGHGIDVKELIDDLDNFLKN